MRVSTLFVLAFLVGCSRSSSSTPSSGVVESPPASASAAPSAAKGNAPAPSALPFCKQDAKTEPLAALCQLGAEAAQAHFECTDPEPIMMCKNIDEWVCKYNGIAGVKPPSVTFDATFDHHGPPIKDGEQFGPGELAKRFPKSGPTRRVKIAIHVADDAEGAKVDAAELAKMEAIGCVTVPSPLSRNGDDSLDCGSFTARVHYLDITKIVYVEAVSPGAWECDPP